MSKHATLRAARVGDWAAVAALLRANNLPLEGARDWLTSFVVALSDLDLVGCAGAETYGEVALLRSVAVEPTLQGTGVGRRLVGALTDQLRQHGAKRVFLLTTAAVPFFAELGFGEVLREMAPAELNQSAEFRGACPVSAVLMELPLHSEPNGDPRGY